MVSILLNTDVMVIRRSARETLIESELPAVQGGTVIIKTRKCLGEHKSAGSEKRYMDVPNANLRMEFARKPRRGEPQGSGDYLRCAEAILEERYMDVPSAALRMQ